MAMPVRTQIYTQLKREACHMHQLARARCSAHARACPGTRSALYTALCLPGVLYTRALHS
eukprot:3538556-Alexandrium_andersonii.AAC.1